MRGRTLLLTLMLSALPLTATAGEVQPWVSISGSWSQYGMEDVNRDIEALNATLVGTGLAMKPMERGYTIGAAVGIETLKGLSLGASFERLGSREKIADHTGALIYDFPAHLYGAQLGYAFAGAGRSGLRMTVGGGYLALAGRVEDVLNGYEPIRTDLKGSSWYAEASIGGEWRGRSKASTYFEGGYRRAQVPEFEMDGNIIYLTPGEKMAVDYSGMFFRVGARFSTAH